MLGTIRKDAPIESDPAAYVRRPGDPAAAAQLLAALEMHKMVARWGLEEGAAPAAADAAPLETVEPSPLPLLLEGRFYAAQSASKEGDSAWYLVQGKDVYLPDADRLAAILDGDAEIWAFDAKPLYRLALEHGGIGKALRFDGKLAAYLLNPSASGYEVHSLAAEYGVHADFTCWRACVMPWPPRWTRAASANCWTRWSCRWPACWLTWSASALQWTPTASAPLATACGASWTAF